MKGKTWKVGMNMWSQKRLHYPCHELRKKIKKIKIIDSDYYLIK
jgi:hypothetical protein